MDGGNGSRMWKSLKQRLGFKRMGCCGAATWTPSAPTILTVITESSPTQMLDDPDQERDRALAMYAIDVPAGGGDRAPHAPPLSGMNLAAALEAERNLGREPGADPPVKTLMRLIEETDGVDLRPGRRRDNHKGTTRKRSGGGVGCDWVCCVCMDRNKGAAFIPCVRDRHAFCRVCSRGVDPLPMFFLGRVIPTLHWGGPHSVWGGDHPAQPKSGQGIRSRELWVHRGCCPICNRPILEILDLF